MGTRNGAWIQGGPVAEWGMGTDNGSAEKEGGGWDSNKLTWPRNVKALRQPSYKVLDQKQTFVPCRQYLPARWKWISRPPVDF